MARQLTLKISGPFTQNTNLGKITVGNTNSSIVTLEGKISDCNNAAITAGYALISFNNIIRYERVSPAGDFSSSFVTCSSVASTCDILGVDSITQQQGNVVTVAITYPITDAGNISACGNSALNFLIIISMALIIVFKIFRGFFSGFHRCRHSAFIYNLC